MTYFAFDQVHDRPRDEVKGVICGKAATVSIMVAESGSPVPPGCTIWAAADCSNVRRVFGDATTTAGPGSASSAAPAASVLARRNASAASERAPGLSLDSAGLFSTSASIAARPERGWSSARPDCSCR